MTVPPAIDLEALLAQDAWIRRLARRLVADRSAAEDLAQEAWVTALAARDEGARARALRPWMGGIVRNLWRDLARGGARRERRERAAARPESTVPADELVAEIQIRKHVAECLLELEEPLRRALYLRFFRDRSLKAIARNEGVSLSTVHERIQRGLAHLRGRLDREHGGRREAWALGLLSIARSSGPLAKIIGGIAMGTGIKVAAAVVLLGGALGWLVREQDSDEREDSVSVAAEPTSTTKGEPQVRTDLQDPAQVPSREALAVGRSAGPSAGNRAGIGATIRGRVLDPDLEPLAGISIGLVDFLVGSLEVQAQESATDGGFEFPVPSSAADPQPVPLDPARATLVREVRDGEWFIVLTKAAPYAGRVVDEEGAPVAGAGVAIEPRPAYFRELGIPRPLDTHQDGWRTRTDVAGRFDLPAAPAGASMELLAWATGFAQTRIPVPAGSEQDVWLVLRRPADGVPLTGSVIGPAGEPVAGARVWTGVEKVETGADGSFALLWLPSRIYTATRPDGVIVKHVETHISAAKEGYGPVHEELARFDVREPITLQLRDALAITGRVVSAGGEPLEGVVVWPADPTPSGTALEGSSAPGDPFNVENALREGGASGFVTSAGGHFALDQLLPRVYRLLVWDPRRATYSGPWPVEAGATDVVLVLDRESGTERVAGRLITAEGLPLAGAVVRPSRSIPEDYSFEPPLPASLQVDSSTDEEGRFEFPALARGGTRLMFFHPDVFMFQAFLDEFGDHQQLEIVAPRLCELQIDSSSDPGLARKARVFDDQDRELFALQFRGGEGIMVPRIGIVEGKSDVVRVSETARTLVLYKEDREVLRVPIRLDPHQRTTIRP